MKKVIVVHGYGGYPEKNWFPWLKEELEKLGAEVVVPAMPNTDEPKLGEWLPHLKEVVGEPSEDVFLVGHSLGCITVLRYLESLGEGQKVGGVILVAGFAEPIHFTELNPFFEEPIDEERIKKAANFILAINSDNDEHVPLWQGEHIRDRFGAKLVIMKGAGHINEKTGFTTLPVVFEELEKIIV